MASGVVVQFAFFSALAVVLMCLFIVYMRPRPHSESTHKMPLVRAVVEKSQSMQPMPMQTAPSRQPPEAERQVLHAITIETESTNVTPNVLSVDSSSAAPKLPVVVHAQPLTIQEDANQRILAGISENLRKSQFRPVPTYSPMQYSETPRDTEYVRIKKQIITPHGQVRFSILKDSVATNMLAVFRRASLDWETPDDLIGFLPAYLQPEAEILNDQVLLIGTAGHNEKLAIPIRSVDAKSGFRDCFDFVADVRTATNTPAVLLATDAEFEVVSRGVIAQTAFMNPVERAHPEVRLLVEKSPEAL